MRFAPLAVLALAAAVGRPLGGRLPASGLVIRRSQ